MLTTHTRLQTPTAARRTTTAKLPARLGRALVIALACLAVAQSGARQPGADPATVHPTPDAVPPASRETPPVVTPPADPPTPPAAPAAEEPAKKPAATARLREEAFRLRPLVKTDLAREFLDGTRLLPVPAGRTVYRDRAKGRAFTQEEFDKLPEAERAGVEKREYDDNFYYYTGYGSPLAYSRPLDLLAGVTGWSSVRGLTIVDFGYGTIGHLRLMAGAGANVVGIEVEPVLRALYSDRNDTGFVWSADRAQLPGSVTLYHGRFPGEVGLGDSLKSRVDVFISKNTLKAGYIHPAREVDERMLVKLGVDDAEFLRSVRDLLRPGGFFMIYNVCPAQNPPDKPYIPFADGKCPFDADLIRSVGFEVLYFDEEDQAGLAPTWASLGYADENYQTNTFAWWTLLRRAAN